MGIYEMLTNKKTPWLDANRGKLLSMAAGMATKGDLGQSLAAGIQNMPAGAQMDVMAQQRRMEEQQRLDDISQATAKKNSTLDYLGRIGRTDLVEAMGGGLNGMDALKMALSPQDTGPKPTSAMIEFDLAKQQGFEGNFMDFMTAKKKAGAININMPGAPTIGSIPQGFQAIQNPDTGAYTMERIPGGPEDQTAFNEAKFAQEKQKATVARQTIQNIRDKLNEGGAFGLPFLNLPETGVIGSKLTGINQGAADVKNQLSTLQSIVAFDRLQAMREASPTGGALGAVSERELALLQSSLGALSQDSSEEDILKTLDFIDGIMAKFEAYPDSAKRAADMVSPQSAPSADAIDFTEYFSE